MFLCFKGSVCSPEGTFLCYDKSLLTPKGEVHVAVHVIPIELILHSWWRNQQSLRHVGEQTWHVKQCLVIQKHLIRRRNSLIIMIIIIIPCKFRGGFYRTTTKRLGHLCCCSLYVLGQGGFGPRQAPRRFGEIEHGRSPPQGKSGHVVRPCRHLWAREGAEPYPRLLGWLAHLAHPLPTAPLPNTSKHGVTRLPELLPACASLVRGSGAVGRNFYWGRLVIGGGRYWRVLTKVHESEQVGKKDRIDQFSCPRDETRVL